VSISAAENPQLVNDLADKFVNSPASPQIVDVEEDVEIVMDDIDSEVELLGGVALPSGEVLMTAEVKELTGRDEEAITKVPTVGRMMLAILDRGVVRIGDTKATPALLDSLLTGDRDLLLLHIYAKTFGREANMYLVCPSCASEVEVKVDVLGLDIKPLDSQRDRSFTVDCKVGPVQVDLPNGVTQKALLTAENKSMSELATILLSHTVRSVNGQPVLGPSQVLDLSVSDRRLITDAITEKAPGPDLMSAKSSCPNCGETVEAPINFGALFRW